jgi:hypothetical protein
MAQGEGPVSLAKKKKKRKKEVKLIQTLFTFRYGKKKSKLNPKTKTTKELVKVRVENNEVEKRKAVQKIKRNVISFERMRKVNNCQLYSL